MLNLVAPNHAAMDSVEHTRAICDRQVALIWLRQRPQDHCSWSGAAVVNIIEHIEYTSWTKQGFDQVVEPE